jgi:hypothetical protein
VRRIEALQIVEAVLEIRKSVPEPSEPQPCGHESPFRNFCHSLDFLGTI